MISAYRGVTVVGRDCPFRVGFGFVRLRPRASGPLSVNAGGLVVRRHAGEPTDGWSKQPQGAVRQRHPNVGGLRSKIDGEYAAFPTGGYSVDPQ